jgi:hypothetical protein
MPSEPPGRAVRPEAASSVGPIAIHYWASLRPCLGTAIAPRRRARFRQSLLVAGQNPRRRVAIVEDQAVAVLVLEVRHEADAAVHRLSLELDAL